MKKSNTVRVDCFEDTRLSSWGKSNVGNVSEGRAWRHVPHQISFGSGPQLRKAKPRQLYIPAISQESHLCFRIAIHEPIDNMAAQTYGILPQPAEDALHSARLLGIEERPFQRVTKRLLDRDSLLRSTPKQLPSPPPEGEEVPAEAEDPSADPTTRQKFREEVLLDFAALESSITRIQLIQSSNARERERYAAEKAKILATAQAVRENTLLLREQLAEAQKVLELRKGYDALASKILEDKKLKSRDECRNDITSLEKEIEELEQEGVEIEGLWSGRHEQFERVVHEGEVMRRVIKGIKEPGEGEGEEGDDDAMEDGDGEKDDRSRMGTPGIEDGRTPRHESGGRTPMPEGSTPLPGGATPMHDGPEESEERPRNKFLEVDGANPTSRAPSPGAQSPHASADVDMGEEFTPAPSTSDSQEHPKASTGLEAKDEQVKEPAEGMTTEMDES